MFCLYFFVDKVIFPIASHQKYFVPSAMAGINEISFFAVIAMACLFGLFFDVEKYSSPSTHSKIFSAINEIADSREVSTSSKIGIGWNANLGTIYLHHTF